MTNNQVQDIQNQINSLKANFCEDENITSQLNILHDQLNKAGAAEWSREELSNFLKSDNDILDSGVIHEETILYADIRNIQDQIINFFGV